MLQRMGRTLRLSYEARMEDEIPSHRSLYDLDPRQLTAEYRRTLSGYRQLLNRANRISLGTAGVLVDGNRLAYASVLFTRIVVTATSVERLLPECKPREHWDFSAVASLTRNLAEVYLWYFWLCQDEVHDDVRAGRFILLYCHDRGSRVRMFEKSIPDPPPDEEVYNDLVAQFDANPYLKMFSEKARRDALKGFKTPFIQDDVLDRMGVDRDGFRFFYRFLSQHTHSGPVAFYRLLEHDRGTGVETTHEKRYMIYAMQFATDVLTKAIDGHLTLFPDAETRKPPWTMEDAFKRVERNQGRSPIGKR